jgi:pentatricopeptide repeat protein
MLKSETDPEAALRLGQREVRILLELGQTSQALAAARSLPGNGTGLSVLGDVLCRAGRWKEAESVFEQARRARLEEGMEARAAALARGPLFLLAEAREDWDRCLELADIPVLTARARRLSGAFGDPPPAQVSQGFPWAMIALLEDCHLGRDPIGLPEALAGWGRGEREWKWRVVSEGSGLFVRRGLPMDAWRRPFRSVSGPVLDPRWQAERKVLKAVLGSAGGR